MTFDEGPSPLPVPTFGLGRFIDGTKKKDLQI
jgi:hypothetical protein